MEYQFELRKEADLPPIRPTIREEVREFYKMKGKENNGIEERTDK